MLQTAPDPRPGGKLPYPWSIDDRLDDRLGAPRGIEVDAAHPSVAVVGAMRDWFRPFVDEGSGCSCPPPMN